MSRNKKRKIRELSREEEAEIERSVIDFIKNRPYIELAEHLLEKMGGKASDIPMSDLEKIETLEERVQVLALARVIAQKKKEKKVIH